VGDDAEPLVAVAGLDRERGSRPAAGDTDGAPSGWIATERVGRSDVRRLSAQSAGVTTA
jgi:hypothetical protein